MGRVTLLSAAIFDARVPALKWIGCPTLYRRAILLVAPGCIASNLGDAPSDDAPRVSQQAQTRYWCPAYEACSHVDFFHRKQGIVDIRKLIFWTKWLQTCQNFQEALPVHRLYNEPIAVEVDHHSVAG